MIPIGAPAPRTIGIVGAGHRARMTYQASIPLGVRVRLLAERAHDGAALVAADVVLGSPASEPALVAFAAECDVLTFDHELVDADALERVEATGRRVRPGAGTVRLAQDKRRQRAAFAARGFPLLKHRLETNAADVVEFGDEHGWPAVAKASRGGYDGRGAWVVS